MTANSLTPARWNGREIAWGRKTLVMAIINTTPDSFSGDGIGGDVERAVAMARQAAAEGADLIDLGGESTRPGHAPVSEDDELARVIPAVAAVAKAVDLPISIDTNKAAVAEAALDAGASIVNDIRGLVRDPGLAAVVARRQVPVVIMHDIVPEGPSDLVGNVTHELERRVERAVRAGIERDRIIVDPGFGFGKEWRENLELLNRLDELKVLGLPILVGFSRKRTIGRVLGLPEDDRLEGTLATTALAIARGADIVRVHDVKPNVRVARMTDAIVRGPVAEGA
jgi:dihydropteroate synthase